MKGKLPLLVCFVILSLLLSGCSADTLTAKAGAVGGPHGRLRLVPSGGGYAASRRPLLKGAAALPQMPLTAALLRVVTGRELCPPLGWTA